MTESDTSRIAELEHDNRRLRQLLDQHGAPGELRHRLRSTLALLRIVVRESARTERESSDFIAHLEDRLDAIMRAQAAADQHGEIGLHNMLADELFHYGVSEGERLSVSGPDVCFQPRAGQVLALAVHELAVNAVEHGAIGSSHGRVEFVSLVAASEPDESLVLTWKELGVTPTPAPTHRGFGVELLEKMLAYELDAETLMVFEPDGLRCTIRFPITPKIGRIDVAG